MKTTHCADGDCQILRAVDCDCFTALILLDLSAVIDAPTTRDKASVSASGRRRWWHRFDLTRSAGHIVGRVVNVSSSSWKLVDDVRRTAGFSGGTSIHHLQLRRPDYTDQKHALSSHLRDDIRVWRTDRPTNVDTLLIKDEESTRLQ